MLSTSFIRGVVVDLCRSNRPTEGMRHVSHIGTRSLQALRAAWTGPDLDVYLAENEATHDETSRITIALCEIEEPDRAADLVVTTMLCRGAAQYALLRASGAVPAAADETIFQPADPAGYWLGQTLICEVAAAHGPAFRRVARHDADEIARTLALRIVEKLDRPGWPAGFAEGATDAAEAFLDGLDRGPVGRFDRLFDALSRSAQAVRGWHDTARSKARSLAAPSITTLASTSRGEMDERTDPPHPVELRRQIRLR